MTGIEDATALLTRAQATGTPCAPVRDLLPPGDIDAAYAVQTALIAAWTAAGARVVGRKIGLTNPKVQAQLGVDRPDFGVLLDDMQVGSEETVDIDRLLQPRIEAEVAFVLAHDLDGSGPFDAATVRGAVGHAVAALEIVDSRVAGWDIGIVDTVADNGSSALFVLGDTRAGTAGLNPVDVTMTLVRTDTEGRTETVSQGSGADCLGDPLAALAWLATEARDRGAPLRAGDVVLSGALGPMVDVRPGDRFEAVLTGLGSVTANFSTGDSA